MDSERTSIRQCQKQYGMITPTLASEMRNIQRVLTDALCNWKSDFCSKVSTREKQIMIVKSTLMAWICRRRARKYIISSSLQNEFSNPSIISKDPNDSMAPTSAQECQLDLSDSSSEIYHSSVLTSQSILRIFFLKIRGFFLRILDFSSNLCGIIYVLSDQKFRTSDAAAFLS